MNLNWELILNESVAGVISGILLIFFTRTLIDPWMPEKAKKAEVISDNPYEMKDNKIEITNSPGSINTIGQQGNNTINNIALGNKPRIIDDKFKNSLLDELNKLIKEKQRDIVVGVVNGADGETMNLFNQIKSFLIEKNMPVTNKDGMNTFYPSNPVFGVKINVVDPKNIAIMIGPKEV